MKNFIKYLILGLLATMASFSYAQIVPTVVNGGVVTLSGKGKLGGTKDGAQWRRYKFARSGSFYLSAYFRSLSNSNNSFTGIAFRNETAGNKNDGGIPCIGLFLENDTLKLKAKQPNDTRFVDVAVLPGVKAPCGLKIVKDGNNFLAYYTTSAENSTAPNYVLMSTVTSTFNSGWSTITQNFATGSRLGGMATAVVNSIGFGAVAETNTNPCSNGGTFNILSVTKTTGNLYDVAFNAAGLYNVNIDVKNSGNVSVRNYSTGVASNPLSVDVGTLPSGSYTLTFTGESCSGTASKIFNITNSVVPAPTIASLPLIPTAGNSVTFTASGCAATVNWYRNNTSNGIQGTSASLTVTNPTAASAYFAKCVVSGIESVGSNLIEVVQPVVTGGGTVSFVNVLKSIAKETALDTYSPDKFGATTIVYTNDLNLGNKPFPNLGYAWKVEGANFKNALTNNRTTKVGIPFMFDIQTNYGGYGVNGVDFVRTADPNNGCVWGQSRNGSNVCVGTVTDIDPSLSGSQYNSVFGNLTHTYQNFASTVPFENRAGGDYGVGLDRIAEYAANNDLGFFYEEGRKGGSAWFGQRDWINGKSNVGISDIDNEATKDPAKSLAIMLGLSSVTQGYVFDQYGDVMATTYIDPSKYPNSFSDPNSTFPTYTQRLDGSNGEPNSGNAGNVVNNPLYQAYWDLNYRISIPSKFTGSKGIADDPEILPCTEVAFIASAGFRQGQSYVYDLSGNTRVVNKFGMNANTDHFVARGIFTCETNKWWIVNKLGNRKSYMQWKDFADAQQTGILTDVNYVGKYITNTALQGYHFSRQYSFFAGMFTFLTGHEWINWDRNTGGKNLDGKNGALFVANLLHQRKVVGSESVSFADIKPRATFLSWTSEISYDGGITYVQDKANHYVMNSSKIPQRQYITNDGYWGGILARPENTESTTCKLRVTYGGQYYYYTVTSDMWETLDYDYRNTALSAIPNPQKDYHYFLIKVGNGGMVQGGIVTAPSITSNVASPTANQSVTLTSSGCQSANYVTKWYTGTEGNLLSTGLTYTVNATDGNSYYAKCVGTSSSSAASNTITFSITPVSNTVIITVPNRPAYYFSDGHAPSYYSNRANLPAIITNTATFDEADVIKAKNSEIEVWFDPKRGGQICYFSKASTSNNRVYNGSDGGLQWQYDATQYLIGGLLNGQTSGSPQNNVNYNTTQGGDYQNHCQTLIDYHAVTNGYYFKFRPILYNFPAMVSEIEMEVTYTLVGKSLKVEYKYTSFRTDASIETNNPFRFMGFDIPICFLTNNFTKYAIYTGNSPWTNGALTEGDIPNTTAGAATAFGFNTKEYSAIAWDPTNNFAVGILNNSEGGTEASAKYEQLNKYSGSSAGTVFSGPYTVMALSASFAIPNGANYTRNSTVFLSVGETKEEVRLELKAKAGY